jgi:hypothetical protein
MLYSRVHDNLGGCGLASILRGSLCERLDLCDGTLDLTLEGESLSLGLYSTRTKTTRELSPGVVVGEGEARGMKRWKKGKRESLDVPSRTDEVTLPPRLRLGRVKAPAKRLAALMEEIMARKGMRRRDERRDGAPVLFRSTWGSQRLFSSSLPLQIPRAHS